MKAYFLLLLLLSLVSCHSKRYLPGNELKAYVLDTEHGLRKSLTKNGITLEVLYRPKDLIIEQEAGHDDAKAWAETEKKLDSLDYFVLRLSRDGQEIENTFAGYPDKFQAVISYLSGDIVKDVSLEADGISTPPEGAVFAQSFGTSNASSILLVFNNRLLKESRRFSIVFDDTQFGTGRSEFKFERGDILNCPRLKL